MSCQDACVFMDYDGSSEFCNAGMRRARKPYRCCECNASIAVGDLYEYAAGKSEGDMWYERTCAPCAEIRKTFVCGYFVMLELWEQIREQLFPTWNALTAIDCLARLQSEAAVEKMRAQYRAWCDDGDRPVPPWAMARVGDAGSEPR